MSFWKRGGFSHKRLYVDAAAATPISARSKRELIRLLDVYGNAGALHKEGVEAKQEIEKARQTIADAVGAHADEIIFTSGGTEANNLALEGTLRPLLRERGEVHAITCAIEHPSVLEPLRALEREGLYTTILPVNGEGLVDVKELRDAINDETTLVSIQLVNSEVGTIEPIREIAKEIRSIRQKRSPLRSPGQLAAFTPDTSFLPLYFHVDASQAPLWLDIKVDSLHADLITLDAQKILGPKGVGALYVRRGVKIEPILWGGAQEDGFRAGTSNTPLIGAFAVALEDAQREAEERAEKVSEIRDYCFEEIKKLLPDVTLNGPRCAESSAGPPSASTAQHRRSPMERLAPLRVANNLNISIPGLEAQMAVIALDAEGIAASTRSACSAGEEEPSHVIQALGVPKDLAGTAIRITFLPDATARDASRVARTLADIAQRYRQK